MTSNEYIGKYSRLCNRAVRDICHLIYEKGDKILEGSQTFLNIENNSYKVYGVLKDYNSYFIRTEFFNLKLDASLGLDNLIKILEFLE